MNQHQPAQPRGGTPLPKWQRTSLTVLFMAALAAFIWNQLPSGTYPTDLSRVGAGRPTVVLAQDTSYASGLAVMELMNKVRGEYAERVDFLVAHLALADAQAFAARHAAQDGTVLLFAADGQRLRVLQQPETVDELRLALNRAFGPGPEGQPR